MTRRAALARAGLGVLAWADRFQRRHPWAGLPLAVVYKFADDQGGYLAALLTYYGFLSVFPLLLIMTTVLGFALAGNPGLQHDLVATAVGEFPIVGNQLAQNVQTLHGSVAGLIIGVAVSLYGGLRVARAGQSALNQVWAIPRRAWPDPARAYARALVLLVGLGIALLATAGLSGLATAEHAFRGLLGVALAIGIRGLATLLAISINTGVFLLAFRVLTARQVPLRKLRAGALAGGVAWQVLQELGTYYIARELHGIDATYGLFRIVLGLLAWIYLGALVTVLAAELNAVRAGRLYPRALLRGLTATHEMTRADRRAYASYAAAQQHTSGQTVDVRFHDAAGPGPETEAERTSPRQPPVR
jgi:YihY family inner membrane protein